MHATVLALAAAAAAAASQPAAVPQPAPAATAAASPSRPVPMHVPDLRQAVIVFLNAYAAGDKETLVAALDPKVELYGSGLSAVYHGISGATDLFDANQ